MSDDDRLIRTWGKRGITETQAWLNTFQGRTYLDIRLWVWNDDAMRVPTRKGISVAVEHLDDLAAAVAEARRRVAG